MNYFKPENYYYIIPITQIDVGIILEGNRCEGRSLYRYLNECFPILRQLDKELADIHNSVNIPMTSSVYEEQVKLIENTLKYLNLPKHILAVGNKHEAIEPVTGVKIKDEISSLTPYRVTDCQLEEYYISGYETKIKNFFAPDILTTIKASKPRNEFVEEVNRHSIRLRKKSLPRKGRI